MLFLLSQNAGSTIDEELFPSSCPTVSHDSDTRVVTVDEETLKWLILWPMPMS